MNKPLFLLMALFACPAFAADGVVPSRVIPSGVGANITVESSDTQSRAVGRNATSDAARTTWRPTSDAIKDTTANGARSVTARGGDVENTKTDINNSSVLRRGGVVLRPSVAEFGGRAIIAGTDKQTGSNIGNDIRKVTGRAASAESIAQAKEKLEQTAELNKSCQDQYNECMDQFCSVVDANQKRCSCSANLSKYSKVEEAVNAANTKLNEVAQNIRYIGLSADEIRAIMTATEAEEALTGTRDNTENRNMLEQIEQMIKDPKTYAASYTSDGFGLDMDLDFSSESDLFSLDFLNTSTSSFSNLRGSDLYNAAKSRCTAVLNQCKKAGATVSQVTGNYDLAIDKDCIAYETGLKKLNETLVSNVRSAERMLQKARLAVMQNKNQYDAKGCIGALETCMTDDMVCGDDYVKCVDPTKKYIDENGNVVLGQNISNILAFMQNYDNTSIDAKFLDDAYKLKIDDTTCKPKTTGDTTTGGDGSCTVKYLLQKIGTGQNVTDNGLCRAVLDKCQAYTYDDDIYQPYNDVVVNYIQRAMINIKAAQYKIIADYASRCMVDVAACYNQQVTQVNSWSSSASTSSILNIMKGACRNVALTCAYAVFPEGICTESGGTTTCDTSDATLIETISKMFYQSLLCPENSEYDASGNTTASPNNTETTGSATAWANTHCKCKVGYVSFNGGCLPKCASGQEYNSYGTCASTGS